MKKALYGITAIMIVFIFGCAAEMDSIKAEIDQLQTKREFRDNIFYSSSPPVKLKLPPEFVFRGETREKRDSDRLRTHSSDPMEYIFESASYLFEQTGDDGVFKRGVLIRIYRVMGNPEQEVPDMFSRVWKPIETGSMKILKDDYTYRVLTCPHILLPREREIPSTHGKSECFLAKGLERAAGFGNKSRVQIIYFEPLPQGTQCDAWKNVNDLSPEQKTILAGFIDRSYQGIRFMKSDSVLDTTSRYVDKVDMDGGDATTRYTSPQKPAETPSEPAVTQEPTPAVPEAGTEMTVETRLEMLKKLLDKGLITPEDYEKKKVQILEDL